MSSRRAREEHPLLPIKRGEVSEWYNLPGKESCFSNPICTWHRMETPLPAYTLRPLTPHYPPGASITPNPPASSIKVVTPQPIITTDSFMFGTTTNGLEQFGCIIEMDDAVVGMACDQQNTPFGFIRNVSDPVINGLLPPAIQTSWAGYIYQQLGLYTSFNSALSA